MKFSELLASVKESKSWNEVKGRLQQAAQTAAALKDEGILQGESLEKLKGYCEKLRSHKFSWQREGQSIDKGLINGLLEAAGAVQPQQDVLAHLQSQMNTLMEMVKQLLAERQPQEVEEEVATH